MDRWLHYELAEKLGQSKNGTTWQAHDLGLERIVVVKLFDSNVRFDSEVANRVIARLTRLCPEHMGRFAEVYAWEINNDQQYLVRQYIEGQSLELKLGSIWPFIDFLSFAIQLTKSVDILHASNLVHANISPNNIMIILNSDIPCLLDPGMSGGINLSASRLSYRSPELVAGRSPSESSDMYALGVIFFRLLTSEFPFSQQDQKELKQAILTSSPNYDSPEVMRLPPEARLLLEKLLSKEPVERFRDAEHLLITLREIEEKYRETLIHLKSHHSKSKFTPRQYAIFSAVIFLAGLLYLLFIFIGR